jgi:hypothetical protein
VLTFHPNRQRAPAVMIDAIIDAMIGENRDRTINAVRIE